MGWLWKAVHEHNHNPGFLTRFLRSNITALSFAVVLGQLTLHFTGEKPIQLEYPVEQDDGSFRYGYGPKDLPLFVLAVFGLTLLRSIFLALISRPVARFAGVPSSKFVKFDDMAWQGVYYATAWFNGFRIMYNKKDEWGFQIDKMTESFPDYVIEADMKIYYIIQASFWVHAIVIQTVEMWRMDVLLYYGHHFITSSLCVGSYFRGATRIGFFILVEQDFADIFLPFAKCLFYANIEPASTICFVCFAVAWIPTRHYLYNLFLLEIWNMELTPERLEVLPVALYWGFFIFLATLQVLLCIWLKDLLLAIYKVINPKKQLADHRSSDEEESKSTSWCC